MSVWKAYIDDSGTQDQSIFVVAGVVLANSSTWNKLLPRWHNILSKYGLDYYHAAAFNNYAGAYSILTPETQLSCHQELIGELTNVSINYITHCIRRSEFELALKEFPNLSIKPFDFLLDCALIDIMSWATAKSQVSKIIVAVENSPKQKSGIYDYLNMRLEEKALAKLFSIGRYTKTECPPLQIADMIAYECYRYNDNIVGAQRPIRKSFRAIVANMPFTPYLQHSVTAKYWIRQFQKCFENDLMIGEDGGN